MIKKLLLLGVLCWSSSQAISQSFLNWQLRDRYFTIQAGTGWTGYIGELTNGNPMSNGLSHFNVGIEARLYSKIGARVQAATYRIEGADANAPDSSYNRQRNLSFRSQNLEWNFQFTYYFLKYRRKYHMRRTYEPYAAVGFGQTYYYPKAAYNGQYYDLRSLMTEGQVYDKSAWVIPVGLGIKAAMNEFINLSAELSYRYAFTSYLDDVSGSFTGPYEEGTPEFFLVNRKDQIPIVNQAAYDQMVPGADRGTGGNDSYFLANLSVEIYIPSDLLRSKKKIVGKKEKWLGKPSAYD